MPLFMTSLDDVDEDNEQIQALRALAYEGTRAEIAENFRKQGNECVSEKNYIDARKFYAQATEALNSPQTEPVENEEEEERKEKAIAEACHANSALCNLQMKNYASCQRDCAAALRLNPDNIKAWYRAASACLAIDKLPEALDACENGLLRDSNNASLKALLTRIENRRDHLDALTKARREREAGLALDQATLKQALHTRGILARQTDDPPDMEDAVVGLDRPRDYKSTLHFPVLFLYPREAQSDLVKAVTEEESLGPHLELMLPPPWDTAGAYHPDNVDCYMETRPGGLIKAGKKVKLLQLLKRGPVDIVDGLVKVYVVPRADVAAWIEDFKKRQRK
ncbi:TPR-like protein [Piedraia hortae CBS 480.64]|uniref:TPR-like protein n=1 Tax=Piedraia hortae CBS 480.64 TaxID=1314780 RepID=A0A6A7BTC3_9PEZI|nr:TPR-like protein [Piedraia hortae CBS 480.64]